jgi:hypothetical protein
MIARSRSGRESARLRDLLLEDLGMTRTLLLPLAAILALATGVGLLGVAATLQAAPVAVVPATATAGATAEATATENSAPPPDPLAAGVPVELPDGPALVRVERLGLAPGTVLPPVAAAGLAALVVEAGTVGVLVRDDGWVLTGTNHPWVRAGSGETEFGALLGSGEHLTLRPGSVATLRNTGPAPAAVVVVAVEPLAPVPAPGERRWHP